MRLFLSIFSAATNSPRRAICTSHVGGKRLIAPTLMRAPFTTSQGDGRRLIAHTLPPRRPMCTSNSRRLILTTRAPITTSQGGSRRLIAPLTPRSPLCTSQADGRLQLTLAIIKPDVVAHPHRLEEVKEVILENDFYFIQSKIVKWSKGDAEKFYGEHKGRFFYNRLVGFMSMGPMSAHILARQDAIKYWRKLMGPTKTFKAKYEAPESLRAMYGLTDTRNATHGSDSDENAQKEIGLFFPDFDVESWYANEEVKFRTGKMTFCSQTGVHVLDTNIR